MNDEIGKIQPVGKAPVIICPILMTMQLSNIEYFRLWGAIEYSCKYGTIIYQVEERNIQLTIDDKNNLKKAIKRAKEGKFYAKT